MTIRKVSYSTGEGLIAGMFLGIFLGGLIFTSLGRRVLSLPIKYGTRAIERRVAELERR